jgi:vacuolar-type H+-ATPase subunit D/Vma8
LSYAAAVHRRALEAGVRYAAVQRAELLLAAELAATRTRQRAVENRWIPRLEDELQSIRRQLDAQELEESLRRAGRLTGTQETREPQETQQSWCRIPTRGGPDERCDPGGSQ